MLSVFLKQRIITYIAYWLEVLSMGHILIYNCLRSGHELLLFWFPGFFISACRDIEHDVNYLLIINYYYAIYVVFIYVNKFEDVYFNLHPCNLECQGRNALLINSLDQWPWIVFFYLLLSKDFYLLVVQRSSKQSAL